MRGGFNAEVNFLILIIMRELVTRFLSLDALNVIPEIYLTLLGVWFLVLLVTVASIASQSLPLFGKILWVILVIALPFGGVFLYTFFCLFRGDYSYLQQMGIFLSKGRK